MKADMSPRAVTVRLRRLSQLRRLCLSLAEARSGGCADRPAADTSREQAARDLFPVSEMSPEEYAARHGADWASFSFDTYQYRDRLLDRWIHRLGAILQAPGRMAACQHRFLDEEELRRVRGRARGPL